MRSSNSKSIRTKARDREPGRWPDHRRVRRAATRRHPGPGRRVLLERCGCWWWVDQELNYFNYFTEIERFYQSKRESFTLLSTLDWVLIENWKEQGIPLEVVLKGIERAFSRPNRKRKINSLAYCVRAVEELRDEQRELSVEAPEVPDFGKDEVTTYLDNLANEVVRVDEGVATSIRALNAADLRSTEQSLSALEE